MRLTYDSDSMLTESEIANAAQDFKIIAGVYFLLHKRKIVYVGQSVNIYARVRRHAHLKQKPFDQFAFIEVPEDQLNEVETRYIRHFKPIYNRTKHGDLRTPETSNERNLNRGKMDADSLKAMIKAYDAEVAKDPAGWAIRMSKKLDGLYSSDFRQ